MYSTSIDESKNGFALTIIEGESQTKIEFLDFWEAFIFAKRVMVNLFDKYDKAGPVGYTQLSVYAINETVTFTYFWDPVVIFKVGNIDTFDVI